jgi:methylenetetrahydrofolate dehydrogenase (NADP+)/methenyltetrahydrofolate cyclohydrolase
MATIIDGKAFAANLRQQVKQATTQLREDHAITPGLAVVLVGEDPASQVYVRNKGKQAQEVGFNSFEHKLDDSVTETDLLTLIDNLNDDPAVHGILVQLPLPAHIDEHKVISRVSPDKDVDGFHAVNVGRLFSGLEGFVPCTPLGCSMLLKNQLQDLSGLHAVIIGRSNIVGKPMAALLLRENCTVTVAHSRTRDLPGLCRQADIVVAAVGRPQFVVGDWLKPGAVVIDVGINRIAKDEGGHRLVGDVDFESANLVASAITPVPGGVGPMTIACLLYNTLKATCLSLGREVPELGSLD